MDAGTKEESFTLSSICDAGAAAHHLPKLSSRILFLRVQLQSLAASTSVATRAMPCILRNTMSEAVSSVQARIAGQTNSSHHPVCCLCVLVPMQPGSCTQVTLFATAILREKTPEPCAHSRLSGPRLQVLGADASEKRAGRQIAPYRMRSGGINLNRRDDYISVPLMTLPQEADKARVYFQHSFFS